MHACMTQSTDGDPSFLSGRDHRTQHLQELQGQRALEGGVLDTGKEMGVGGGFPNSFPLTLVGRQLDSGS